MKRENTFSIFGSSWYLNIRKLLAISQISGVLLHFPKYSVQTDERAAIQKESQVDTTPPLLRPVNITPLTEQHQFTPLAASIANNEFTLSKDFLQSLPHLQTSSASTESTAHMTLPGNRGQKWETHQINTSILSMLVTKGGWDTIQTSGCQEEEEQELS